MVLGSPKREGAQAFAVNVLKKADKNIFQIDFAFMDSDKSGGYIEEIRQYGSQIFYLPKYNVLNHLSFAKAWKQLFKENQFDIIHGNVAGSAGIYLKIAKQYNVKTIYHSHNAFYRGNFIEVLAKKLLNAKIKKNAEYWLSCSDLAAVRAFGKKYSSNPNYFFVPNPIDVEQYLYSENIRNEIRKQYSIDNECNVYGHVGSFTAQKNHLYLLKIFKSIKNMDSKARFILIGDGPLRDLIKQEIIKLKLENDVILTGSIKNVNEVLMALDVFVFPSKHEGLPISVLEAESSGLPCLLSDRITKDVAMTNGVKYISLETSYDDWAEEAIHSKKADRTEYNKIMSQSKFDINKSTTIVFDIYKKIISL